MTTQQILYRLVKETNTPVTAIGINSLSLLPYNLNTSVITTPFGSLNKSIFGNIFFYVACTLFTDQLVKKICDILSSHKLGELYLDGILTSYDKSSELESAISSTFIRYLINNDMQPPTSVREAIDIFVRNIAISPQAMSAKVVDFNIPFFMLRNLIGLSFDWSEARPTFNFWFRKSKVFTDIFEHLSVSQLLTDK